MESFDDALKSARDAVADGSILRFDIERERDSTAGSRYIVAHSDQGSFVWWPMPQDNDEYEYWEDDQVSDESRAFGPHQSAPAWWTR